MQITPNTRLKDFANISVEASGAGYVKEDDHNFVVVDSKIYCFTNADNKVVNYVGIFQREFEVVWFARCVSILNCDGILIWEF